jgi:hypothetical protein
LPVTGVVEVAVMRRAEIRDYAKASMYEHNSPEQLRLFTRIEASMGVLPVGADGEAILLDMLESGVMGLYEPKNRTLYIGTHVSEGQLDMVVGHEIAHGLQDMHFGLKRLQAPIRGDSDAESARTYLVEGDAQAAYLAWVSGAGGPRQHQRRGLPRDRQPGPRPRRHGRLPRARALAAAALRRRHRDDRRPRARARLGRRRRALQATADHHRADAAHRQAARPRGPRSPSSPTRSRSPRTSPGHKVVWQDNVGEASLLAMLADVEPAPIARASAAGWGGDRYLVLEREPADVAPIVVGLIAWDSERDAEEFAATFQLYLEKAMPGAFVLERRGAQVLYASQVRDAATAHRAAQPRLGRLHRRRQARGRRQTATARQGLTMRTCPMRQAHLSPETCR